MAKLAKIFRGLTVVLAGLLVISVTIGVVMEQYPSSLDTYLGTQSSKVVTENTDDVQWIWDSEFTSAKSAYEGLRDFAIEASDETMVLLKNKVEDESTGEAALPIAKDAKITLLGLRSYAAIYGNDTASIADIAGVEDNTIYESFADEGFQLNPQMLAAYEGYCNDSDKVGGWAQAQGFAGASPAYSKLTGTDDIPEASFTDLATYNANYASDNTDYDTAIVVFGRPGGESDEYRPGSDGTTGMDKDDIPDSGNILGLSQKEKAVITYAEENFNKVIVLVNSTQQLEIDSLKNDDKIDAILWIGYPGAYGFHSVARVLNGTVNPSAHLGDIYAVNTADNPSMMNFGDMTEWAGDLSSLDADSMNSYCIEAEGIYTGYRYYETRYYDTVVPSELTSNASNAAAGQYVNADGTLGTADGTWDYDNEVSYGFGYGLSYTSFTQEFVGTPTIYGNLKDLAEFTVKVTNTGSVAGKDVIQLYVQVPYTSYDKQNNVEKSAIQLIDYEKTDVIEPGESQTITLYVDMSNLASYDYTNAKTYILDYGDYYFALGNGAHEALENVLAKQGYTTSLNTNMTEDGDAEKVYTWNYTATDPDTDVDSRTFSTSDTGETITNVLTTGRYATDILNGFDTNLDSTIKYLSRSDWKNTYPETYSGLIATSDDTLAEQLTDDFYTLHTNDDTSDYVWGVDSGITMSQMQLAEWDDDRWDDFVNQVTIEEFLAFAENSFHNLEEIESVGFAGGGFDDGPGGSDSHYLNEGSYKGEAFTDINDVNPDSPSGHVYGDYGTRVPPSATNLAYSWNKELCYRDGQLVLGESTLMLGMICMCGPATNLHRNAYNGRGAEYYSEDPILSGYTASAVVQGAQSKGCFVNVKHLAFNSQEINRSGVAVFMTEQKAREMELRNFQQSLSESPKGKPSSFIEAEGENPTTYVQGANGVMTSYNRIGATVSSANKGVMVDILRNEWGFKGYNITDFTSVTLTAAPKESLLFGTCAFCGFGNTGGITYWNASSLKKDSNLCAAIKLDIKYALYSLVNSAAVNGTNDTTHKVQLWSSWRIFYVTLEAVTGTLFALSAVAYVVCEVVPAVKKKKEG
ncbi:MAG: glycoside hydrolase family 3 C-terminal domain-containing protein [Clostridia bacterium]|nr:glycoside hydrolase family 3 C-terminal domain-containing protein [Clostridia bacterium]